MDLPVFLLEEKLDLGPIETTCVLYKYKHIVPRRVYGGCSIIPRGMVARVKIKISSTVHISFELFI